MMQWHRGLLTTIAHIEYEPGQFRVNNIKWYTGLKKSSNGMFVFVN